MNALHGHFKPEFLNRVDDIIIFRPLGKEQLVKIVDLRLEDVRRLLADRKDFDRADRRRERGDLHSRLTTANFGARPLKRAIQKLVQDPLALKDSRRRGAARRPPDSRREQDKSSKLEVREVSKRVGEKGNGVNHLQNCARGEPR